MRTVHETEALRPSDPIPKSMHGASGGKGKLKIIIKTPQSQSLDDALDEPVNGEDPHAEFYTVLSKDLFTTEELTYPTDKLYRKCYWEAKWAEEIGESLKKECQEWEEVYHKEWLEKEALVAQVIESEIDWHTRRQAILSGVADVQISGPVENQDEEGTPVAPAADDEKDEKDAEKLHTIENGLRPSKEVSVA